MHIAYVHYLSPDSTGMNHVLQFAQAARGLGHRVDVHGANSARELGHRVDVPGANSAPASSSERKGGDVRQAVRRQLGLYLREPKLLLSNVLALRAELELLRAARPDVLLVRHVLLAASGALVASRLKLPLVIEVNAPVAESRLYADEYFHLPWIAEWLESSELRRSDGITVVSTALKRHLMERCRLPDSKFTVVPTGADLERFHPEVPPDPTLPEAFRQGPVVGFVGSFQKFHGVDLIARMVIEVGRSRPSVRFLFVGDGPEAATLRRETSELGERILFTGSVPHTSVPGMVAALDVSVLPETAFYCSPLKVVEWMAAGKAVVAPRYEPVEELIEDGVHGLLFPPRDAAALIEAVQRLVDDSETRVRMGRAAAQRARASLSWEDNARRVIEVCQRARDAHRGRIKRADAADPCSRAKTP